MLHLPELIRNHGTVHDFSVRIHLRYLKQSVRILFPVCCVQTCTVSDKQMVVGLSAEVGTRAELVRSSINNVNI